MKKKPQSASYNRDMKKGITRCFFFFMKYLLRLVEFERQVVGVEEKGEAATRVFVNADRFGNYVIREKGSYRLIKIINLEGQMAQPCRLGARYALRRIGKREELDEVPTSK